MCVATCPTGTMNFGDREEMVALAEKRLAELKKEYPGAMIVDADSVNVIYLITEAPEHYHEFVVAKAGPSKLSRGMFLAKLGSPLRTIG